MAPKFDLKSIAGLAAACQHIEDHPHPMRNNWKNPLQDFLKMINATDLAGRSDLDFHRKLWDDNPVSDVGQGTVSVAKLIEQSEFRSWVAKRSLMSLPAQKEARLEALNAFYDELVSRFNDAGSRVPHLKIFRVLAAFFPGDFTTIADRSALARLARRMRGVAGANPVALHAYIRDRLDEAIGPPTDELASQTERLMLAWYLYARTQEEVPGEEPVTMRSEVPGDEKLVPLPALRRRRGLTSIAGGFPALLPILQELKDGLTRDELLDVLRPLYPHLKESSRRIIINILRTELGLIKSINNEYVLTERGAAVLETSSAAELGEWLLTRILGVDHVLKELEKRGKRGLNKAELVSDLQLVHPGWTSDYMPNSLISWLLSMNAIGRSTDGRLQIKALGQEWADKIHWTPEPLKLEEELEPEAPEPVEVRVLTLPQLAPMVTEVTSAGVFPPSLVEQLHLGLWSPARRHFAVLAGISGSGKTLLATKYAQALGTVTGDSPRR